MYADIHTAHTVLLIKQANASWNNYWLSKDDCSQIEEKSVYPVRTNKISQDNECTAIVFNVAENLLYELF